MYQKEVFKAATTTAVAMGLRAQNVNVYCQLHFLIFLIRMKMLS